MLKIREEIRNILREELSALFEQREVSHVEYVRIDTSEDLNVFVKHLFGRFSNEDFVAKVRTGEIRFSLKRPSRFGEVPFVPATTPVEDSKREFLDKKLITEADLASFGSGCLCVPLSARITPLAKDEAQRRGIRIEKVDK